MEAAQSAMEPAFSFFSEVSPDFPLSFMSELGPPHDKVRQVAKQALCPFPLALAT